jgi:outer membrane receptor protein involved in Fe transport
MKRISPWFMASCAVVAGLAGTPAFAQDADEEGQRAGGVLEEIIVTALKRSQILQNIPISVTAFSGSELEKAGIQDVTDLSLKVPGLSVSSTGPGQTEVIIRGMPGRSGTSPTVGYYLDEVPISAITRNLDVMIFDLERVEVLRGPQGTLYGASSMGGTVKYVGKRPNLSQFEGRAETTLSHIDGSSGLSYKANVVLNIPLQDERLGLRLLASHQSDEGFIDRYAIHPTDLAGIDPTVPVKRNVNSSKQSGFRAILEYAPNENWTITPSVTYQKLEVDAPYLIDVPPGSIDEERFIQTRFTREDRVDEVKIANLTINWEGERIAVTSSTSVFNRETPGYEDYSKLAMGILGVPINVPWEQLDDNSIETYIQELRVVGSISSLDYVVGVYYSDSKGHYPDINPFSDVFYETFPDPLEVFPPIYFGGPYEVAYQSDPRTWLKEKAIFAEGTYHVTDALAVTVGVRAFETDSRFKDAERGLFTGVNFWFYDEGKTSESDWTPKFNISYQVNDDTLLFATAAEGFRSGAAVSKVPEVACAPDLAELGLTESPSGVESDSVWSYELGAKMRMLDGRMILNSAVYFIDWSSLQQGGSLACGWPFLVNNGNAEVKGGELEWGFAVSDALSLSANLAYSDAKLTELFSGAQGFVGARLLNVPKWAYSATADYSRPLTSEWDGFVRISYNFVDEVTRIYDPASPFNLVDSHDRVDLRIGAYQADRWEITLFAQNLLNEVSESGLFGSNTSVNLPTTRAMAIMRPRTIGLTASFNFN